MNGKRQRTACFTGHRQMEEPTVEVERKVSKVVEDLVQRGYLYFGAGGARGFDALASEVILKLKKQYPKIHLILVLPFDSQYRHERNWEQAEIAQYHRLKTQASKVVVLAPEYSSGVYYRRNKHLVDNSSICIAYMTRENSGTSYTVNYARAKKLQVVNIAAIPQLFGVERSVKMQ